MFPFLGIKLENLTSSDSARKYIYIPYCANGSVSIGLEKLNYL